MNVNAKKHHTLAHMILPNKPLNLNFRNARLAINAKIQTASIRRPLQKETALTQIGAATEKTILKERKSQIQKTIRKKKTNF